MSKRRHIAECRAFSAELAERNDDAKRRLAVRLARISASVVKG
jgi:hypothetical protein